MPEFYLRSADGSDSDNGSTWALAKATLVGALAAMSAGDTLYIADGHSESQAADMTITSPGTAASWCILLTVDDTGDPEPPTALATGSVVATTTSGDQIGPLLGYAYCYGVQFRAGNDNPANATSAIRFNGAVGAWNWILDNCLVYNGSNSATGDCVFGTLANRETQKLTLIETDVQLFNTGQNIALEGCHLEWFGGSLIGAPTGGIFELADGQSDTQAEISGVDLSTANATIASIGTGEGGKLKITNCKFPASHTGTTGTIPEDTGTEVLYINCNDTDVDIPYSIEMYKYGGSMIDETTIVRTGGASDGVNSFSWKLTDNGSTEFFSPLYTPWIEGFLDSTGSKTFTVQIVHDSVTNLQNDEVWLEVETQTESGTPQSSITTDRMTDIFSTPADQSTTGDTWTTTGLTNPNTQDLSVTITVDEVGPFRARIALAKGASYTIYVCPLVDVT